MEHLISRIRAGTTNHQVIIWPGTETRVKLRILSRGEFQDAVFSATRYFEAARVEVLPHTAENFEEEKVIQLLYRSLSDLENNPVASDVDAFRMSINKSEVDELAASYAILEQDLSPSSERMPKEEYDRFLEALKKKPEEIISSVRNIAFARRLLRSMVATSES